MMIKLLATVLCIAKIAHSAPYQYNHEYLAAMPASMYEYNIDSKQDLNGDPATKYDVGYEVQDTDTMSKMKKEYTNNAADYHAQYSSPDTSKRSPPYNAEFVSYDDTYSSSTPSAPLQIFPYTGQLKFPPPSATASVFVQPPPPPPKLFIDPEEKPAHHLVPEAVGHYIADVAGQKLKHVGEALESGALTEPIIHKLSFAKAALLHLLAIVGPLSAAKTIHVVARASDSLHRGGPLSPPVATSFLGETYPPPPPSSHPPYPPTLTGMILHFVSQLSKFNTDARLHLIPNLLKLVSYASSSSAHRATHS